MTTQPITRFEHGDRRVCELQGDGTWKVRENPLNEGVVSLTCERTEHRVAAIRGNDG